MSNAIPCFFLEPTGRTKRSLRRYASGSTCATATGCHDASAPLDVVPDAGGAINGGTWSKDDPRWPKQCSCGYAFAESDNWQVFPDPLYRRADTGGEMTLRDAPPGAMWDATWCHGIEPFKTRSPDGRVLILKTPGGEWCLDDHSTNGPGWTRTGTPPRITANPSILIGSYHAWLRDGQLVPC